MSGQNGKLEAQNQAVQLCLVTARDEEWHSPSNTGTCSGATQTATGGGQTPSFRSLHCKTEGERYVKK